MMFSIIMPAYNAEKYIEESIRSVLNQTFADYELLIINDCSTDNTVNIVKNYQTKDPRIKLLENNQNSGVAITRNKGIEVAKGKYVCFLDSDDLWEPTKLEKYVVMFQQGSDVLYSFYTRFNDRGNLNLVTAPLSVTYKQLLKGNCIGNLTGAYNAKKIGKIFQKNIRHEDYLMWLEILQKTKQATCVPENLAFYRVSNASLSGNKFKSLLWTWEIYYKQLQLGIIHSTYLLVHSIIKSIVKRV